MRISDWSSDVCSSDLASLLSCKHSLQCLQGGVVTKGISHVSSSFSTHFVGIKAAQSTHTDITHQLSNPSTVNHNNAQTPMPCICKQIGRASCRERVCQ